MTKLGRQALALRLFVGILCVLSFVLCLTWLCFACPGGKEGELFVPLRPGEREWMPRARAGNVRGVKVEQVTQAALDCCACS